MFSAQEALVSVWDRQRKMLQRLEAGDLLLEALAPRRTPFPGVPAIWSHRRVGFWKGWGEMPAGPLWKDCSEHSLEKYPSPQKECDDWPISTIPKSEWASRCSAGMLAGAWRAGLSEHTVALPEEHRGVSIALSCLTLGDPTACSPPGCSVPGILQARLLEWVTSPFSRGSSGPQGLQCSAGRFFTIQATREARIKF